MSASTASSAAQIECVQGIPVATDSGRFRSNTAPIFESQTPLLHIQPCARVLLDVSAVTSVSSAGLRSMIKLIKHTASSGGRTGPFSVPDSIMALIEISGFQPLLDIYPDREIALKGGTA